MKVKNAFYCAVITAITMAACNDSEVKPSPTNRVVIENQEYATIKIGTQTWTAVNYAGPGGVSYNSSGSKPEYGKYYSFDEVKKITLPEGWHLPTMQDYTNLALSQNVVLPAYKNEAVKTLTSLTNWKNVPGNNASGFNAYPTGYIFLDSTPLDGDIAEFWTNDGHTLSIQEGGDAQSLRMVFYDNSHSDLYKFTVRFVKD